MKLVDLKIHDDGTIDLLDFDDKPIVKNIDELEKIVVVDKITFHMMGVINGILLIATFLFPPILLYWLYRWYKKYKNSGKKYIFLEFKETKKAGITGTRSSDLDSLFFTDLADYSLVEAKLNEIDKVAKSKNILISVIEKKEMNLK